MKKIVAVIMIVVMSLSVVNADISGFTRRIVKAKIAEVKSYQKKEAQFKEYERERAEKWRKWGNEILEKKERGVKYDKETLEKAERAVNYEERTYKEYTSNKEINRKKKEYGDKLRQRNEFGFWRYFGSKLFGEWVKYAFNKNYGEPRKKSTKITKANPFIKEDIPETFDTNVDMPVELLQNEELDVYFYTIFPNEIDYSDLWNREEMIEKIKKDYALAVPYEVFFENIVLASEEQCKVMYEQLKVKSEAGESQKETLLRLFVFDYERRTENGFKKVYRDIGVALSEANNMLNGNTPVPTPTPIPITGGF